MVARDGVEPTLSHLKGEIPDQLEERAMNWSGISDSNR